MSVIVCHNLKYNTIIHRSRSIESDYTQHFQEIRKNSYHALKNFENRYLFPLHQINTIEDFEGLIDYQQVSQHSSELQKCTLVEFVKE